MKLTYDSSANIAYLALHAKTAEVETIHVSDELNIDIAPDGSIYGIELLNANEQLEVRKGANLVIVDTAMGQRQEIPLAIAENKADYRLSSPPNSS